MRKLRGYEFEEIVPWVELIEDMEPCTHIWATYCPIQEEYHCLECGEVYE